MSTYSLQEKPGLVQAIAVLTLISGVVNIFWGILASVAVMATLIGIICVPVTILPTILGIFEVIYATRLLSTPPRAMRPSTTIAALEIACILTGNVFSSLAGILVLVFYNDPVVQEYFQRLNAPATPVEPPPAPPEPIPPRKVA